MAKEPKEAKHKNTIVLLKHIKHIDGDVTADEFDKTAYKADTTKYKADKAKEKAEK